MLIIAGHLVVGPKERDSYVAECVLTVKAAHQAPADALTSQSQPTAWIRRESVSSSAGRTKRSYLPFAARGRVIANRLRLSMQT
jgi:hypothetical protein